MVRLWTLLRTHRIILRDRKIHMIGIIAKLWRLLPYQIRLRVIRLTQPKFTVSVVAIVLNSANEVLVLDHFIRPGSSWGLPGGFIEKGEVPIDAIKRELHEETALELRDPELLRIRTVRKHIEVLFFGRANGDVALRSSEIRDYGWYSKHDLPAGMSETQRKLVLGTLAKMSI